MSYLGLGRVFTANMTGNVVLLGFGVAGAAGLPVLAPVVSLVAFLFGSAAGGRLALRLAERRSRHLGWALACEVSLIIIAAVVAELATISAGNAASDVVIALLAFAMGLRNATVRRIGIPDLTTTVLTMTLTAFASEFPGAGGSGAGSVRRLAAVAAMFTGALVGALLLKTSLTLPLIAAAGLAALAWLVYIPAARGGGENA